MRPPFPNNAGHNTPLTPRLTLRASNQWNVAAHVAPPAAATLGAPPTPPAVPLDVFTPAEPPITLDVRRAPAAVLSDPNAPSTLELAYTPAEDAVYVLLQEIQTPDGAIYDVTLPRASTLAPAAATLGAPRTLAFPVTPLVPGDARPPSSTLGWGDVAGGFVGDLVATRVLHVLKSPLDRALLQAVRQSEPVPRVLVLRDALEPLDGFEAWRALLPPGKQHRVLLFVHGFGSSTAGSGIGPLLKTLAGQYDAVLSYDHPTVTHTPLENALDLLAHVPDDLQLAVDIVAHSRGGLVSRSLIELVDPMTKFAPRRLISHGSPHEGTRLADPERWDRLISIGMTAASWLAMSAGVTIWVPKVLEYMLKAAAQSIFALPGIEAMRHDSAFLQALNAVADSATDRGALQRRVQYAAVSSAFSIFNVQRPAFRQALQAMATQAFIDEANDLIVPTSSMNAIDKAAHFLAPERQLKVDVDHFSYFRNERVIEFLQQQLS
jgi:hypothetical protein